MCAVTQPLEFSEKITLKITSIKPQKGLSHKLITNKILHVVAWRALKPFCGRTITLTLFFKTNFLRNLFDILTNFI